MGVTGRWAAGAAYVAAYVLLDALSYVQPLLKLGITPWSPQAGLTVAFLFWRGWRAAPWTVLAALAAELGVRGAVATWPTVVACSLVIGAGYGLLVHVLERTGAAFPIRTGRVAAQLFVATGLIALLVAVGYALVFAVAGVLPWEQAGAAIARYWVGDLNGVLTVTPLLVALPSLARLPDAVRGREWLLFTQAIVLVATVGLVFGLLFAGMPRSEMQFVYMLFAPVVWITWTWGVTGAAAAALAIQIGMMLGAVQILSAGSLLDVQFLLVTLAATALLLGGVVSERARAVERAAARETEQRALLAAAPDAVLAADPDGCISSANTAAEKMFEASASGLIGSTVGAWLPEWTGADAGRRIRMRGRRAAGGRFPAEVAWVRLGAPAGPGYLLVIRDITERESAQAQLRERDAALARSLRFAMAGELATALTHELNQPIMALVSYMRAVEILAEPLREQDPRLAETLQKASRQAQRASDVLRRLRAFYLTGTPSVVEFPLHPVFDEVAETLADRVLASDVTLSVSVPSALGARADRTQLQIVLHNLISNALESMPVTGNDNRVSISAMLVGASVCIAVEDTGPGIPEDIRSQIFEPFVTSKPNGLGLGLAISRSLLRAQGGELRLETTSAAGTRFIIEIPAASTEQAAA